MESLTIERTFRPWRYSVGHSTLLLHSPADREHDQHLHVLFEDVRAVKLRSSYQPLTLEPADSESRFDLLDFAGIPPRFHDRYLCLTLPAPLGQPGFVVSARVTVTSTPPGFGSDNPWAEGYQALHVLRAAGSGAEA